jgi:tellurite resistance protein TerA
MLLSWGFCDNGFDTIYAHHDMQNFIRGQKVKLADLGLANRFQVEVALPAARQAVDVSCFGLDAAGRLSDERYMVFYNQLSSPGGAVALTLAPGQARFQIDLDALPASIDKLVFTAAVDGAGSMRDAGQLGLRLAGAGTFTLGAADFVAEKAVILAELYQRDGAWRFGAVGQGFEGGLAALLKHFGGEEARPAAVPAAHAAPASAPVSAAVAAPPAKVSLSKITLEKRGDKISLDKRGSRGFGRIRVNLDWNRQPAGMTSAPAPAATPGPAAGGLLGKLRDMGKDLGKELSKNIGGGQRGVDLDLGCLYELSDGTPGVIQALGNSWGSFDGRPFIRLEGDDRTGSTQGGENMLVNGDRFDQIRRVLVFALIYKGVANWAQTDGVVTIDLPDQPKVEVRLDNGNAQRLCAIAMIENRGGQLQVTKLAEYLGDQRELDQKYGFGLRWQVGKKD